MATFAFESKAKGNVSFTDEGMNETRHFPINACGVQVRPQSEARETETGSMATIEQVSC